MLGAVPLAAQTPQVAVGKPLTFAADHDGANTASYRLASYGDALQVAPAAAVFAAGVVTMTGTLTTPGTHAITITAISASGEAASSAPLLVEAVAAGCPAYVTPQGVAVPHAAGDVISGWNNFNLGALAGMQAYTARLQQLVRWNFAVVVDGVRVVNGYPQVHLVATCQL